jgi:hypothetical protein
MIARLCLGLSVSVVLVAPAVAELAMTGAPVAMRAAPTGKAGIVQRVPQNAQVDVGKCARDWCRASWRGRSGYIPAEAVALGPPRASLAGDKMPPPFVNAPPADATPPAWQWQGFYLGGNLGFGAPTR